MLLKVSSLNKIAKLIFLMPFAIICFVNLVPIFSVLDYTEYELAYSTYLGGNGTEGWGFLSFDNSSNCVLISNTDSTDFPMKDAIQSENKGERDAICLKLNTKGEDILYSTYFGGSGDDFVSGATLDSQGNMILAGATSSKDFPLVNALVENSSTYDRDVFVFKLSPDGQEVIFSTYLGSASIYYSIDVTIDSNDNIIVTGSTSTSDFLVKNAYQENISDGTDAFITKITPDGQEIIFSTFLGGSNDDQIKRVTTDQDDNIIVIGVTSSSEQFPIKNALEPNRSTSSWDVFLSKLSPDGQELFFSTFYGGTRPWGPAAIICDSNDNIIAAGETNSLGFPVVEAFQEDHGGGELDTFLSKISPDGQNISFSTYIGGSSSEGPIGITLDSKNNILLTGSTGSNDFKVKNAYQEDNNGWWDGFFLEFSPNGQDLIFSSYFGGSRNDYATSIVFLPGTDDSFLLTGHGDSTNLPLLNPYQESYGGGDFDLFLCRFEFSEQENESSSTSTTTTPTTTDSRTSATSPGFDIAPLLLIGCILVIFLKRER